MDVGQPKKRKASTMEFSARLYNLPRSMYCVSPSTTVEFMKVLCADASVFVQMFCDLPRPYGLPALESRAGRCLRRSALSDAAYYRRICERIEEQPAVTPADWKRWVDARLGLQRQREVLNGMRFTGFYP